MEVLLCTPEEVYCHSARTTSRSDKVNASLQAHCYSLQKAVSHQQLARQLVAAALAGDAGRLERLLDGNDASIAIYSRPLPLGATALTAAVFRSATQAGLNIC